MLQVALTNWYSGRHDVAEEQFQQLYATKTPLSPESYRSMGHYFFEKQSNEQARVCFARYLQFQYDEACMRTYVELVDGKVETEQVMRFVYLYEEQFSIQMALCVMNCLAKFEKTSQAYALAIKILRKAEEQLAKTGQLTAEHVALVDFIVARDVAGNFLSQARFQVKKLLYLTVPLVAYERIVHWSVLLELVDCLQERVDYRTIKENSPTVYRDILTFYELFTKRQINTTLALRLSEHPIEDQWLQHKVQAIIQMSNLLQKKSTNGEIVQKLYASYPMDLFIAKLYMLTMNPMTAAFWDRWLRDFSDVEEALQWYEKRYKQSHVTSSSVEVLFLGGGEKIGGTAIVVKSNGRAVLLDAGMFLNQEHLLTNFDLLQAHNLTLQDLDAVFVSHAHLDHTGSLPYITKVAPHVPMYATAETKKLMQLLLKNVVHHQPNCPYSEQDVGRLFMQIQPITYKQTFNVGPWRVTFYEAGHIVGAASILLELDGKTILFTGDISVEEQLTCGAFAYTGKQIDVLITESTYGYLPPVSRLNRQQQRQIFIEMVEKTTMNGGICLIPAFAVGRAQEILQTLTEAYDGFFPFPVIVDGVVPAVCDIYESTSYFTLPDQVIVANCRKRSDVRRMLEDYPGAVIITSSGMLNEGSQSSYYAYEIIDDPKSMILFTGYLDPQSPAYDLFRHQNHRFKIEGEPWKDVQVKRASYSLSAHVQRDELFQVITKLVPAQVLLMHGEHDKRFESMLCRGHGKEIYPSIVELLDWIKVPTICAKNNQIYSV